DDAREGTLDLDGLAELVTDLVEGARVAALLVQCAQLGVARRLGARAEIAQVELHRRATTGEVESVGRHEARRAARGRSQERVSSESLARQLLGHSAPSELGEIGLEDGLARDELDGATEALRLDRRGARIRPSSTPRGDEAEAREDHSPSEGRMSSTPAPTSARPLTVSTTAASGSCSVKNRTARKSSTTPETNEPAPTRSLSDQRDIPLTPSHIP